MIELAIKVVYKLAESTLPKGYLYKAIKSTLMLINKLGSMFSSETVDYLLNDKVLAELIILSNVY